VGCRSSFSQTTVRVVILEFFKGFGAVEVFDDTGCVHHARTEEELVEVVPTYTQEGKARGQIFHPIEGNRGQNSRSY